MISKISKPEFYQIVSNYNLVETDNKKIQKEILRSLRNQKFFIPFKINEYLSKNLNYKQSRTSFIHDISMKIFEFLRQVK